MEKTMENHLVDPTEKAENAESSENVTDKRNQKYITPNNRLTIIVQQGAANTRLDERLRLVQRRQSEQHKFANFNVGANCGGKSFAPLQSKFFSKSMHQILANVK